MRDTKLMQLGQTVEELEAKLLNLAVSGLHLPIVRA